MSFKFLSGRIIAKTGDITREPADAIVNAANSSLLGGGGVDGAIHAAGGPEILEACKKLRREELPDGLATGDAVITTAGDLPARYVIHTVGPVYGSAGGREQELLADCYTNSLELARSNSLASIAFPAISTGVYGYPADEAARVSSKAVAELLLDADEIECVTFVFFSEKALDIFFRNAEF